jgi:hypothetical protein
LSVRWLLLATLIGCAQATAPNSFGSRVDSGVGGQDDANTTFEDAPGPRPDAPASGSGSGSGSGSSGPMTKTLDEAKSDTALANTAEVCPATSGGGTDTNSFFRVFTLSSFSITTAFDVTNVDFWVEDADANANNPNGTGVNVTVKIGTYSGTPGATLSTGSMTQLATMSVAVPQVDENGGDPPMKVDVPITATIPAGGQVYFELDSKAVNKAAFYPGVSTSGETADSYIEASDCGDASPTDYSTAIGSTQNLIMTVTGTY